MNNVKRCSHCERKNTSEMTITVEGKVYSAIGNGWGFHNLSFIVIDQKGLFHIFKDDVITQPIEYCPKCGSKLGGEE